MVVYEGLFFRDNELIRNLEKNKLPKIYKVLHCTFKYKPSEEEIFYDLLGHEFEIKLIGYGSDSNNSGFQIELPKELKKYFINYDIDGKLKVPHITASLSENADSDKTNDLVFLPLLDEIKIIGKFGCLIRENDSEYVSYDMKK
jgi:hypothetical protein